MLNYSFLQRIFFSVVAFCLIGCTAIETSDSIGELETKVSFSPLVIPFGSRSDLQSSEIEKHTWALSTKSQIAEDAENCISSIHIAVYNGAEGEIVYDSKDWFDIDTIEPAYLSSLHDNYVVAVVNMPGIEFPLCGKDLKKVNYTIPSLSEISSKGMPMVCQGVSLGHSFPSSVSLPLTRLMAKFLVLFDNTEVGDKVTISKANVRNWNTLLLPFEKEAYMRPSSKSDIVYSDDSLVDFAPYDPSPIENPITKNIENGCIGYVYVPVNCQGELLDGNLDPDKKTEDEIGEEQSQLCSYLEITTTIDNIEGKYGTVNYRFYLGRNNTSNFDVAPNEYHVISFKPTPEGLNRSASWWKVDDETIKPEIHFAGLDYNDSIAIDEDVYYDGSGYSFNSRSNFPKSVGVSFTPSSISQDFTYEVEPIDDGAQCLASEKYSASGENRIGFSAYSPNLFGTMRVTVKNNQYPAVQGSFTVSFKKNICMILMASSAGNVKNSSGARYDLQRLWAYFADYKHNTSIMSQLRSQANPNYVSNILEATEKEVASAYDLNKLNITPITSYNYSDLNSMPMNIQFYVWFKFDKNFIENKVDFNPKTEYSRHQIDIYNVLNTDKKIYYDANSSDSRNQRTGNLEELRTYINSLNDHTKEDSRTKAPEFFFEVSNLSYESLKYNIKYIVHAYKGHDERTDDNVNIGNGHLKPNKYNYAWCSSQPLSVKSTSAYKINNRYWFSAADPISEEWIQVVPFSSRKGFSTKFVIN